MNRVNFWGQWMYCAKDFKDGAAKQEEKKTTKKIHEGRGQAEAWCDRGAC